MNLVTKLSGVIFLALLVFVDCSHAGELIPRPRRLQQGGTAYRMRMSKRSTDAVKASNRVRPSKVLGFKDSSPYEFRMKQYEQQMAKYEHQRQKWEVKVAKQATRDAQKKEKEAQRALEKKQRQQKQELAKLEKKKEREAKRKEREQSSSRGLSIFGTTAKSSEGELAANSKDNNPASDYFASQQPAAGARASLSTSPQNGQGKRPSMWQRLKRALFGS